ncbi:MAG: bidirectional hydrogenase complex protein HoxE [Calditerrivibrio sp.]|nr:bidirectional hydrogenase complex protein HoxE [Calditerrivibrio sp.]
MFGKINPPSDDKRWRFVLNTMKKYGFSPDALIEVLHTVQEYFGYIDESAIRFVSESLKIPFSKTYGVVTFYHFFTLKPKGEHTCVVCTGTACYIKGAGELLNHISLECNIKDGETTKDGKVSLLTARCVGACSLAPVIVFDNEIAGNVTKDRVNETIKRWTDDI